MKRCFLAIFLCAAFTGCETAPSIDEVLFTSSGTGVAMVKAGLIREHVSAFSVTSEYLNIKFLDGRKIGDGRIEKIEVQPGNHVLEVARVHKICNYYKCKYGPDHFGAVSFTAKAGKIYKLKTKKKNNTLYFWLIDALSGKVVSAQKPPKEAAPQYNKDPTTN